MSRKLVFDFENSKHCTPLARPDVVGTIFIPGLSANRKLELTDNFRMGRHPGGTPPLIRLRMPPSE